jgi:nucleoid-associated protein YgaU
MGLIDFMVNTGQKLWGSAEEADEKRQAALTDFVKKMRFEISDFRVDVKKDVATVFGKASDQMTREKVLLAIGNTEGIARVDDRMEVHKPEPQAVFYTVPKGDTLSKIAKEHYADAARYPEIFAANKPMLTDPDKIYPGQVLRIPDLAKAS